jgi:GT2 family glycosyltransferase
MERLGVDPLVFWTMRHSSHLPSAEPRTRGVARSASSGAVPPIATPPVTAIIATHRDMHLVVKSLAYLFANPTVAAVIVNNDTTQDVASWLDEATRKRTTIVESGYPAGYARATNNGLAVATSEFVLFGDSDLFVEAEYVERLLEFMASHPRAGCASGKLLRIDLKSERRLDIIDSAGVMLGRNRRPMARGEGQRDEGQFDEAQQLFGVDGAGLLVRRSALESIKVDGEYFDESFFMYKEDTDLCWRLRLAGWECWYVPEAVAYHGRTSKGLGETRYLSAIRRFHENEQRKPAFARACSMRNQWLMLVKDEDGYNFLRDFHLIAMRELMVLGYNLVFAPSTLKVVVEFSRLLPKTMRKRRSIKARQAITPREMRRWFGIGPSGTSR